MVTTDSTQDTSPGFWFDALRQLVYVSESHQISVVEGKHGETSKPALHPSKTWRRAVYQQPPNTKELTDCGYLITRKGRFWLKQISKSSIEESSSTGSTGSELTLEACFEED